MKYLLLALTLIVLKASGQDSVKISVTLQARDLEYIGYHVSFNERFESIFDSAKLFFRVPSPPSGTTAIKIDSIPIAQWLGVSLQLRYDPIAVLGNVHSRLVTALGNVNNTYLNSKLAELDTQDTAEYMRRRQAGRFKLRRY